MTINPFELLGIDPHKTSIRELKRRYYDLALLVHPDKNNDANAAQEMDVLHKAYLYCLEQIENVQQRGDVTVESLEQEFEEFCKVQEAEVPFFQDILEDAYEMKKFNEAFEQSVGFKASFQGGYGELMETSKYAQIPDHPQTTQPTPDLQYNSTENEPLSNDFSSLIVYTEPISFTRRDGDYLDYTREEPINNYTVYVKNMCLTDYKEANSKQEELTADIPERTLEQVIEERALLDSALSSKE
jgi:hypothetical protein